MKLNPDTTKRLLKAAVQVTIGSSTAYLLYAWGVGNLSTELLVVFLTLGQIGLLVYIHREVLL